MNVTIYGSGYVGLVTGAGLAEIGHHVLCVDINAERVQALTGGECPIYEPGLVDIIRRNIASKRLAFTLDKAHAIEHGVVQMIAVGTPCTPCTASGVADISAVEAVARNIGQGMTDYRVIVNKSTVPVGTSAHVSALIAEQLHARQTSIAFAVVSNPEFLKEGDALHDFLHPDRIIIGCHNEKAVQIMRELYAPLLDKQATQYLVMDNNSAELSKYAANALLATKISFMNELSHFAQIMQADIEQVRVGIGSDPRIGVHFIHPGCGYGGSCFPKDVKALIHSAEQVGVTLPILQAVEKVNDRQKRVLFNKLQSYFQHKLTDKTIAVWGLAFKPGTDDIREASSRVLIEALLAESVHVKAYDPKAMPAYAKVIKAPGFELCASKEDALHHADALVIVTEWDEFKTADLAVIKQHLNESVIFDGRNCLSMQAVHDHGMAYVAIGRGDNSLTQGEE